MGVTRYRQPVLVKQDLRQHGAVAAQGKLESVVFNLVRQRPMKLTAMGTFSRR